MRSRRKRNALSTKLFNDCTGKRRTLNRVGSRTKLVEQNERIIICPTENVDNIFHVRRKGRERLLNALFVANVRKYVVKHRDTAVISARNHHSAHRHQRDKADRFKRDRFAAGVRTRNDKAVKFISEHNVNGNDCF